MSSSNLNVPCVAIIGDTGVGKSTLVNVLMGAEVAETNNNVRACTTDTKQYTVHRGGTAYCHLLDTRGLNEPWENIMLARIRRLFGFLPRAEREVRKVLRGKDPRFPCVDLVLLCIDANKFRTGKYQEVYRKICDDFCEGKLSVEVVVTRTREDLKGRGDTAKEVLKAGLIGVPEFKNPGDPSEGQCRGRILRRISNACHRKPVLGD